MKRLDTKIQGLVLVEPARFGDERGFFMETWQKERYDSAGINAGFVQDNLSKSRYGVLRGLHLQNPYGQDKLISVIQGEVFDVAVDVRVGSPTFGQAETVVLTDKNRLQFYIPPGFAHGFVVTSESALFMYKCTETYHPETELTVKWNDPTINIPWPIQDVQLSEKDAQGLSLQELEPSLPRY